MSQSCVWKENRRHVLTSHGFCQGKYITALRLCQGCLWSTPLGNYSSENYVSGRMGLQSNEKGKLQRNTHLVLWVFWVFPPSSSISVINWKVKRISVFIQTGHSLSQSVNWSQSVNSAETEIRFSSVFWKIFHCWIEDDVTVTVHNEIHVKLHDNFLILATPSTGINACGATVVMGFDANILPSMRSRTLLKFSRNLSHFVAWDRIMLTGSGMFRETLGTGVIWYFTCARE